MVKSMGGREIFIGVDLGKLRDYTAICAIDVEFIRAGRDPVLACDVYDKRVTVRILERVRLGTSYPRVVRRVREVANRAADLGRVTVVVDATGLGGPVVDMFREADVRAELVPVTISGGEHAAQGHGGWTVPKAELMVGLQMMVAEGELRIAANLPLRREFLEEALKIGPELHAKGTGHDDLVMAMALGCWRMGERGRVGERAQRLL